MIKVKKHLFISVFFLVLVCLMAFWGYAYFFSNSELKSDFLGEATVKINDDYIRVMVMDTPEKRVKGLSGMDNISKGEGFFFIFDEPKKHGFWMKDMKFSIDIIWINENGEVVSIKERASKDSYPEVFYPSEEAIWVLEILEGEADRLNIKIGSKVWFWRGL